MKKYILTLITGLFITSYNYSQVRLSEVLQESRIATSTDKKLFFLDFWATWCVPCLTAKEHLGVLQKQYSEDFYVLSLTQQNPVLIEKFLKNKPTNLAIGIDYNSETFNKYKISSLPQGILFNAKGNIIWQGHSADLKAYDVSRFLRTNTSKASIQSFFKIIKEVESQSKDYIPTQAIEIKPLNHTSEGLDVVDNANYLKLNGSLKHILSYLSRIYENQIQLSNSLNANYEVYFKKPFNANSNLAYKLITKMKLKVHQKEVNGEVINFNIKQPKFWDTNQIVWGNDTPKYLVGDMQIQADDVSLKDVAYQLAHVLEMPVIIPNDTELTLQLHDWDFHYKYFELMQTDLEDNYGIVAKKETLPYKVYEIKKAP